MKQKPFISLLVPVGLALLSGCGSGGGSAPGTVTSALHESRSCIGCHENSNWKTPGSGQPVVAEWNASTHNSTTDGAGCQDCHGSGYLHPASCNKCHSAAVTAVNPLQNPDASDMCAICHDRVNPRVGKSDGYNSLLTANGVPTGSTTRFTHFSSGMRTNYVSSNNRRHCRNCHNPHDNSFGREQRKAWSESGHGNTRGLARILLDGKTRGTNVPLNLNEGNNNYCVRCHTTAGFINFLAGDTFTNVNALPDIGADGLPDPSGFRSNAPEYTTPRTGTNAGKIVNGAGQVFTYKDSSREATNCNACHLDVRASGSSAYSGALRPVALKTGVKIHYPYSSIGYKTVTPVLYDTLGNSNLCLTCHSGRATGKTIREPGLIASIVADKKPAVPSIHDFAGGAVLEAEKSAFLFYTSPARYKTFPAHRALNADGNGPCITCHMPRISSSSAAGGVNHSHVFRPVSWVQDDLNQDITDIISNATVCSECHNGSLQAVLTPALMNQQLRKGIRVSLLILARLLPASSNWIGPNTNITPNVTYGTTLVPRLGNMPAAVYTMGASYNYGFLFNEPSSYNHSPILARQLIYDSIDWLKNGPDGFGANPASVYAAIKSVPIPSGNQAATPPVPPGFLWTKVDVIYGEINGISVNKNYAAYTAEADRNAAFFWLCKDYVDGSNVCNRW
ncbi:MAG TPA: hypothetical protein HPP97_08475 [Desulfuromonadales bacterium]|nr:hypothetical protein [Desulfuromonadales bacterium]